MSKVLQLCEGLPRVQFDTGEIGLHEKRRTGLVYVLIEGEIEILRGELQIETSKTPGAVFGEMSMLDKSGATADVS